LHFVNRVTRAARRGSAAIFLVAALAAALPATAAAAAAGAPFAAPQPPTLPGPSGGLLRVVLALALVLGAVVACASLMRRLRGIGGGSSRAIEVLAQASLGARERAVLVRVGGHELLLGVASGSVRTLLVLGDTVAIAADAAESLAAGAGPASGCVSAASPPAFATAFRTLLARSLGQ
jgi:flagellar protein FliO/FliZ